MASVLTPTEWKATVQAKKSTFLSVNVFSTKVLIGDNFYVSYWRRDRHFFVVIRATRRSSRLQRKGSICNNHSSGPTPDEFLENLANTPFRHSTSVRTNNRSRTRLGGHVVVVVDFI